MKFKKTYITLLTIVAILGTGFIYHDTQAQGKSCIPGQTQGNIYGYLTTQNIGPIYLSTESWNDNETVQTSVQFSVSYNRQLETWDGRGWNGLVGWVDFGFTNPNNMHNNTAEFESVLGSNQGAWGNMNPVIDLAGVNYVEDPGVFVGQAYNGALTTEQSNYYVDDEVGAGIIGFSNVELLNVIDGGCNEFVDLLLDGVNILYQENCSIPAPEITWNSENVSDCETNVGLWQNPGSRNGQNTSGEQASGAITTGNSPTTFRLKCVGDNSGSDVYGMAVASCGPTGPGGTGIDPTSGIIIPDFREV